MIQITKQNIRKGHHYDNNNNNHNVMLFISENNFDSIVSCSCNGNGDTENPTMNHELMSVDNHEISSIDKHEVDCYCSSLMRCLEFQSHINNHEEDFYCSSLMRH